MAKKLTAAQRTLIHPAIDMHEVPQPEPYVKPGAVVVRRLADGAIHFFLGAGRSLCGDAKLSYLGSSDKLGGHGTCASCRVEASRMRAVVR